MYREAPRLCRRFGSSTLKIVFDLDGTLTLIDSSRDYADVEVNEPVVAKLREYKAQGYEIIIQTARNMRTYDCSVGKINANTLPVIIDWLNKHEIPFDEIHVGKPWCGTVGFYVDDKAIRPDEFASMSKEEIAKLIGHEAHQ